ncbi:hypothetical protein YB2330_005509 [Saitoella coloradoensis]
MHLFLFLYELLQRLIHYLFSPRPPLSAQYASSHAQLRVAIIGAGLTGVSSAAHCIGHGVDVVLFEKGGKDNLGGIWTKVNDTSGLQINSLMYRFHPDVTWHTGYPTRSSIVREIRHIWTKYDLQPKTRFDTDVKRVSRSPHNYNKWIINNNPDEEFDAVIAAIGTCGEPKMVHMPGMEKYKGTLVHSSELTKRAVDVYSKEVAVVGGGASAVEALQYCVDKGAREIDILARSDKWIIPRHPLIDALISLQPFGHETVFSFIPEFLLRTFFYRDLKSIAPPPGGKGLFSSTPMVNSTALELIRQGRARWLRGDIVSVEEDGIKFIRRAQGIPKGGSGHPMKVECDAIIMATGFHRPSLHFLPEGLFTEEYMPPAWFLQTWSPNEWSILANNCTFVDAIGTAGHFHIGIYTRILIMYLKDPRTRPTIAHMRSWVDRTNWFKNGPPGQLLNFILPGTNDNSGKEKEETGNSGFGFFTYGELLAWFVEFMLLSWTRIGWIGFVLCDNHLLQFTAKYKMSKRAADDTSDLALKNGSRAAGVDADGDQGMGEFEDQWEDEFESEEEYVEAGEDGMDVDGEEEEEQIEETEVWLPNKKLGKDEVLEADQSVYEMLHTMNVTWPSLSFDVLWDNLGEERSTFPATTYLVTGTQAAKPSDNEITIMKLSSLNKTQVHDEESDDEDEAEEGDPIIEHRSIKTNTGTNRIRATPKTWSQNHLVATMMESGEVHIFDIEPQFQSFDVPGAQLLGAQAPLHTIKSHGRTEGFAVDWHPTQPRLLTGDCAGKIYLTSRNDAGQWSTTGPFTGHTASVEDIQWSPSEPTVFASCASDGTLKIYDTRSKTKKPALSIDAHPNTDVNVLTWNKRVNYLLATGADDGRFSVWDLRTFGKGKTPEPVATFKWHTAPITSIEFHPTEDSVLAVAGADDQVTLWDLSVELDAEEEAGRRELAKAGGMEVPSQLMFVHQGQEQIKEVHWHPQIPGVVVSTAGNGFNVFKTISV